MRNYPGILQSDEFQVVQDVFKKIVAEPWFSRDIARQQQFGAFVIVLIRAVQRIPASSTISAHARRRTGFRTPGTESYRDQNRARCLATAGFLILGNLPDMPPGFPCGATHQFSIGDLWGLSHCFILVGVAGFEPTTP